jgi:hypothetical protein
MCKFASRKHAQLRVWLSLTLCLVATTIVRASDLRQTYVGKSSCSHGLQEKVGTYGIRLDKKQTARLEARTSEGKKILMIVQYQKEWDDCGTVRDIIQSADSNAFFEFECVDDKNPGAIAVGTWRTPKISGPSLESWRVELDGLKFVPITRPVRFIPHFGAGNDDGSDLAGWARQRGAKSHRESTN